LKVEEEKALPLIEKRGEKLAKNEEKMQVHARQTAELIEKYGKAAAVSLSARRVSAETFMCLRMSPSLQVFYELVLKLNANVSKHFRISSVFVGLNICGLSLCLVAFFHLFMT
jgi:hypothetical protein